MSLKDKRGISFSTGNRRAVELYEEANEQLLCYFGDPLATIDRALAEDPEFVMGHCFRAGLIATTTDQSLLPELQKSSAAAKGFSAKANERERAHIAAVGAWAEGDLSKAVQRFGDIVIDHPHDIFALQLAHLGDFFLGQSSMLRDRIAQALPGWSEAQPGYGYVLGMYAFGLEETADYAKAEQTGGRALQANPRDPWAVHAVTHVMEMQGRQRDGIDWLVSRTNDWAPENAFAFHNWWHLGLFHLDLGDTRRVLEVYDRHIRPQPSKVPLEMVDASAMLWRLHLRGIDLGDRWNNLADSWREVGEGGYYAFNDLHALLAFVAAGREADIKETLAAMKRAASGGGTNAAMTREVGLPIAQSILAFSRGAYDQMVETLLQVRLIAHRFGGSHAQRDLVNLTLVEAALRGNRPSLARALTAERTALKPTSPFNWQLAARALAQGGDKAEAEAAKKRAATLAA